MQDESFGIIPLRKAGQHWEVFLIQHRHGRHWGFPKGHSLQGESHEETALRELQEETNLTVVRLLRTKPLIEHYSFMHEGGRIFKRVSYFIAQVSGDVCLQEEEVSGGEWLSFEKAQMTLTHSEGKSILAQTQKILETV